MKKVTTSRSIVALMVIFFAVATSSCKKEDTITPGNPPAPTGPAVPTVPVTPAVSMKPRFITTTENGRTIRKEEYKYDTQGKLTSYATANPTTGEDSVLVFANSVSFKRQGSNVVSQVLVFNTDKTFKSLFGAADQINFNNDQTRLSNMIKISSNGGSNTSAGEFAYSSDNLSSISAEVRIDINYDNSLPYQKGINEIPVVFKPLSNFKVMEQENATATMLYSKLIKQVIITSSRSTFETHNYSYVMDENNRVTKITEVITNTTASTSSQKTRVKSIAY